jgi:hypothetical protein
VAKQYFLQDNLQPAPPAPLNPYGGVAVKDAERAGATQAQHAEVVEVRAITKGAVFPVMVLIVRPIRVTELPPLRATSNTR